MKKRGAAGPTGGGPKSANIDGTPTARDARDDDSACCATPLPGTRIVYSRKVGTHSSGLNNMMACHLAVVAAHNAGDHEKAQRRHEIKLQHVDGTTAWWEALCNVYEVLQPSSATSPTRTCEGVRGDHFPPRSQNAFSRLCELAADEKARLDGDALRMRDPTACMLSPGIAGILSHSISLPPGAEIRSSTDSPLTRHFHLRPPPPGCGATKVAFHDLMCTHDRTIKPRRRPNGCHEDTPPPMRCGLCQHLFAVVRSSANKAVGKAEAKAEAAADGGDGAALAPAIGAIGSRAPNVVLTTRENTAKTALIAADKKNLARRLFYYKQQRLIQLADVEVVADVFSVAASGGSFEESAKEHTAVFSAACSDVDTMKMYFTASLKTPERVDAAVALMESCRSNMLSYVRAHVLRQNMPQKHRANTPTRARTHMPPPCHLAHQGTTPQAPKSGSDTQRRALQRQSRCFRRCRRRRTRRCARLTRGCRRAAT